VVSGVVDGVNTDSVDPQFLKLYNISRAGGGISNRIDQVGGSTGLVVNTTDVESSIALEEGYGMLVTVVLWVWQKSV